MYNYYKSSSFIRYFVIRMTNKITNEILYTIRYEQYMTLYTIPAGKNTQSQSQCGHTVWYTLWTTLCSHCYDCVDLAHFHTVELCKHSVNHSVTTP